MPYGIYNFSARGSTTWFGFAKEIAKHYNAQKIDTILPSEKFQTLAKRPKYSVLNLDETEKYFRALNHWETSVGEMVKEYKNRRS